MDDIIDQLEGERDDDLRNWALYIGQGSDYYVPKWYNFKSGKSVASFNIAAFFLGVLWMLFRKMYLAAAIWLMAAIAIGFLEEFLIEQNGWYENQNAIETISNIIISIVMGFFGNYFYYLSAERKIQKIKGTAFGDVAFENELKRQGGVSWGPPLIAIILYALLIFALLEYL